MISQEVAQPIVLVPHSPSQQLAQYDCDCACASEVPSVLAAQYARGAYDCDCACALDVAGGQAAEPDDAVWVKQEQLRRFGLGDGWQVYFNPVGPVGVAVLNAEARQILAAFEAPLQRIRALARLSRLSRAAAAGAMDNLVRVGLLRPAGETEGLAVQPSVLSAWLHVTEACNLNCPYCYVQKSPRTMNLRVGSLAVDRLVKMANRHGYRSLKLKYAGGEPMLKFSLVRALHLRAIRRAAELGLGLEEVILSNGVGVTDVMLDFVARTGMRLMVSLDGGQVAHNRVRACRDGGDTYDQVVSTVARALERGLRPNISITLTALNLDGAADAVAFALERDLPFNLNFYRECSSTAPAGTGSPLVPEMNRLKGAMLGIFDLIAAHPTYPLPLTGILDRTRLDVPHTHPCSAGRDYLAVDTQGEVSACQMMLGEPWADLTQDDPLETVRQRGSELFESVGSASDCHRCPWRAACSGGCPLMRESRLHDDYCSVYRTLLPKLIQLEAHRLIAAQAGVRQ